MATNSPNKGYVLPATGDFVDTWGVQLDSNVFSIIDLNQGGRLAVNVGGSSDVTLSSTDTRNVYINCTGVLTGNIGLIFPASAGGYWVVRNATTGSFSMTAKPSGGSGVAIPQGTTAIIFVDPDNTRAVFAGVPVASSGVVALTGGGTGATTASDARTNLGLGTMATVAAPAPVASGGTGATSAASARSALGTLSSTDASFLVNKGGSNQNITAGGSGGAFSKITWGAEVFDVGGFFDLANNKWTPPAGTFIIGGCINCQNTYTLDQLWLYKNGAAYRRMNGWLGTGSSTFYTPGANLPFSCVDQCSGSDYFELYVQNYDTGSIATPYVVGTATLTFWSGSMI